MHENSQGNRIRRAKNGAIKDKILADLGENKRDESLDDQTIRVRP